MSILISRLKGYVAGFRDFTDRTTALEQRLKIGTGLHGKWYRSQRDHWLGWLVVLECRARSSGRDPANEAARGVWQRLNCSPMMFWLADVAGVASPILDSAAEAAVAAQAVNPKDGPPPGRKLREELPWELVESTLISNHATSPPNERNLGHDSFSRLIAKNAQYRRLKDWLY